MSVFDLRQWLADADRAGELEHVRGADAVLEIDGAAVSINMEAGKHGAQNVRAWFAREGRAPAGAGLSSSSPSSSVTPGTAARPATWLRSTR